MSRRPGGTAPVPLAGCGRGQTRAIRPLAIPRPGGRPDSLEHRQYLPAETDSQTCSTDRMRDFLRPDWWPYPAACRQGHTWGPGRVTVGWIPCGCGGGPGTSPSGCGQPGCRETWHDPAHAPGADQRGPEGEAAARYGHRVAWHAVE